MNNENIGNPLLHIDNPIECRIIGRLNRFVIEVEVDGVRYRAHTNNTGRLHGFLEQGRQAFCTSHRGTGKTDYSLFAVRDGELSAIIDTQLQMRAFEAAVKKESIPWLRGFSIMRRNARLQDSLIDYLLAYDDREFYLEVKSAVMRDNHYAMYPDCPTARGRKHIAALTAYVRKGGESALLFIAALPEITAFKPNKEADRELFQLLTMAHKSGVMLKAINLVYRSQDSYVYLSSPDLPVSLE